MCGRKINLIDTPGFNDTEGLSNEVIVSSILYQICMNTASKTVDCFLIAESIGSDKSIIERTTQLIIKCFGVEAAKKIVVLMTKGEALIANDDEVENIDKRVEEISNVIKNSGAHDSCYWTNLIEPSKKGKPG